MKSKKNPDGIEKLTIKSEADICKPLYGTNRLKKKQFGTDLFKKSANFLQNYNNLFRKPSYHFGDADTYFKQSLRNYDDFDFLKGIRADKLIRSTKSTETFWKKGSKGTRVILSPKKDFNQKSISELQLDSFGRDPLITFDDFSPEFASVVGAEQDKPESFYSPNSQLLGGVEELPEAEEVLQENEENTLRIDQDLSDNSSEDSDSKTYRETLVDSSRSTVDIEKPELETQEKEDLKMAEEFEDLEEELTTDAEAADESFIPVSETDGDEEDDEMKEVEQMIAQASNELEQVAEENQQLMDQLKSVPDVPEKGKATTKEKENSTSKEIVAAGDGSIFKFDSKSDAAVLNELDEAEKQAKQTAKTIYELKLRVGELYKKGKLDGVQSKELQQINKELKAQMLLFEEKTKRIQFLIGQANLFENMIPIQPPLQTKHTEDMLPKLIVCGLQDNNMPKIIVCDEKKSKPKSPKTNTCTPSTPSTPANMNMPPCMFAKRTCSPQRNEPSPTSVMPQFAQKLNESYCMQEKLAAENADLEGMRFKLQSDLLNKDQTVECLQRQVTNLQSELRMVCKENCLLNEKLHQGTCANYCPGDTQTSPPTSAREKKMPCGRGKATCPAADVERRLLEYSDTTQNLEKQLGDMEKEVKSMQQELLAVQKEREHLEHHRKMLCVPPSPCTPCPTCPPPHSCPPPSLKTGSNDQQFRELKEQYNRLQDDFKGKLTEVAGLRADIEKLKTTASAAEEAKKAAEEKLRELERNMKKNGTTKGQITKEQMIDQEQQLTVAKQRFREAQDELEELRALIQDQQGQIDDYRNKYLQAQQQVEEQKRQIDLMELENNRVSEQVNLEIQRVKNQFQEKLQELTPLPDILKTTQLKLQEAQQMHLLAERNNEAIGKELQTYKDKVAALNNQMKDAQSDQQMGADQKATLTAKITELEEKIAEMQEAEDKLRSDLKDMEELAAANEKKAEEKLHEIAQLTSQLETVREESARQVSRIKDRCETVRRSIQNQVSDLERQLAQSRAQAKAAQKDRDEIRQKMQAQINNLNENFEDAQMRIKNLQGHVNFLKNTYNNVFPSTVDTRITSEVGDPCTCGPDF